MRKGERPVVYQEPVQFDPRRQLPFAPITSPTEFGQELAKDGLFETAGWATATNPYTDELIDDETFWLDVQSVVKNQHRMFAKALRRGDWRLFFGVLAVPDRVQHVYWRDRDPEHPAHDAKGAKARGDRVLWAYAKVDELVGWVTRNVLKPDDVLLVVSDHGFAPWRHAVNLNRWLAEEGLLVATEDGRRTLESGVGKPVFSHIDWSKTRAYSLGLGRIWLNLKGREPQGIVDASEAPALLEEVRSKLLALEHEGRSVIFSVAKSADIYSGDRSGTASDLVVGFERGYRVSWDSCLGGLSEPLIAPNRTRWSGDHCSVDPTLVPGVCVSSFAPRAEKATVLDVLPTLRALLGLAEDDDARGQEPVGRSEVSNRELLRRGVHIALGVGAFLLPVLGWKIVAILSASAVPVNAWLLGRLPLGRLLLREGADAGTRGLVLYPLVVFALCVVFRERHAPIQAGWLALAVGDGCAPLLARRLPHRAWPWNRLKSIWSSGAAFVLAAGTMVPLIGLWPAVASASAGCLGESLPAPSDDNLTTPVLAAAACWTTLRLNG